MRPSHKVMEKPPFINITTPKPLLPIDIQTEDYQNYEYPDDAYTEKLLDVGAVLLETQKN